MHILFLARINMIGSEQVFQHDRNQSDVGLPFGIITNDMQHVSLAEIVTKHTSRLYVFLYLILVHLQSAFMFVLSVFSKILGVTTTVSGRNYT